MHACYAPLFGPGSDEFKAAQKEKLALKFAQLEKNLGDKENLTGSNVTVADLYAYVMMGWAQYVGFDLKPYTKLAAFHARIAAHPKVAEAHAAMNAAA